MTGTIRSICLSTQTISKGYITKEIQFNSAKARKRVRVMSQKQITGYRLRRGTNCELNGHITNIYYYIRQ